jgi:hypothetical protein
VTVIAKDVLRREAPIGLLCDVSAEALQLPFNVLLMLLTLSRDASIDGDFHVVPPAGEMEQMVSLRVVPSPIAEGIGKHNPIDADRQRSRQSRD